MLRLLGVTAIAIGITSGLFLFMGWLVKPPTEILRADDGRVAIEFVRMKRDSMTEVRKRKLPEKPKKLQQPKTPKVVNINQQSAPVNKMPPIDMPPMDLALNLGNGPNLGQAAGPGDGDQDIVPLVRIEPQYPRKAAMAGTQGWVELQFDIDATGRVSNVAILKSEPRRLFDSAARRALLRWKYRPKTVDGKGVARPGNKVRIDFKLE